MPSKLFILLKGPHEFTGLEMMKHIAGDERSGVILFEDAAYFAVDKKRSAELLKVVNEAYVMADDLAARGFEGKANAGYRPITYHEAVDLIMEKFDQTITL
ncbi:MAG: sulfurtransferase complex subunit TusB [Methanomassiliicoccales archaeon]|nr:MAG: sulfurtransferase complex subunit TusB [Methanomassiliicoccales archaeon]